MSNLTALLSRTLQTAGPATAATTAALAACGSWKNGNSVAPINAVSHIVWGDDAASQDDASFRHTAPGVALNAAAIAAWSAVYELAFGPRVRAGDARAALIGGATTAALAYVTDYYVVPRRLTPGFEKRLSLFTLDVGRVRSLGSEPAAGIAVGRSTIQGA